MVIELSGVIWAEIIRGISKSNERAARVRNQKYDFRPKLVVVVVNYLNSVKNLQLH